jgi:acyl dehydratase
VRFVKSLASNSQELDAVMSPISVEELAVGYEFPATNYELSQPLIARYLEAVGGQQYLLASGVVPPLAIAAYAMAALSQSFSVPKGAIHAAQELEFLKSVPIGTTISCSGKVVQKVQRGPLYLLVLEINALNQDKEKVLSGKATIAVPT